MEHAGVGMFFDHLLLPAAEGIETRPHAEVEDIHQPDPDTTCRADRSPG
jgi:hypothetical protein